MPEPILSLTGLEAFNGDFQALYGIDMEIYDGEVVALIGANGAGKSKMMRSIAGLISDGPGQIRHRGEPIGAIRADQVAYHVIAPVPEGRQLFPSLSVEETLVLGGQVSRAGPWSFEKVYELFPILKERRRQASTSLALGRSAADGRDRASAHGQTARDPP